LKKAIFFLLLASYQNIFSEEISSKIKRVTAVDIFTLAKECESYEEIKGKEYCLKKSSITLNSCGQQSDWPCMKENGCLIIDKFTLIN